MRRNANAMRKFFAMLRKKKIEVPASVWRRRYIAISLGTIGVIYNTQSCRVCGLLDAEFVNLANLFALSLSNKDTESIRFNCGGIPLSVAIMCYVEGYFTADEFHVHHKGNSADNRYFNMKCVEPYSDHPPKCFDSMMHIGLQLARYGFTPEEAAALCMKCVESRKTRLDF